jgi:site-specific DNA recombinase
MNALFLKDLARKTHRGQRGRIEKGFSAGGAGYGYRMVRRLTSEGELVRGELEIVEAQALTIDRVFREFAAGKGSRAIARDLNAEGVPGPGGRAWSDTTIRGSRARGIGILNNEIYVGVLVWNHKHTLKDPRTGRTGSAPTPNPNGCGWKSPTCASSPMTSGKQSGAGRTP